MGPLSLHVYPAELSEEAKGLLSRFEDAWEKGAVPRFEDHCPSRRPGAPPEGDQARLRALEELIKLDLTYRWRQAARGKGQGAGAPPRLEEYLGRYPELVRAVRPWS
jgi:hypothetical protein